MLLYMTIYGNCIWQYMAIVYDNIWQYTLLHFFAFKFVPVRLYLSFILLNS